VSSQRAAARRRNVVAQKLDVLLSERAFFEVHHQPCHGKDLLHCGEVEEVVAVGLARYQHIIEVDEDIGDVPEELVH